MIRKLTETECLKAVADGEFSDAVRNTAPAVALVLTQSWCPQWRFMRSYLDAVAAETEGRAAILYVEYDHETFFEPFMAFKEDVLGNREVPYVRYYRAGKRVAESNYLSKDGFLTKLGIEKP